MSQSLGQFRLTLWRQEGKVHGCYQHKCHCSVVSDYAVLGFYYLLERAQADSTRDKWIKNVLILRDDHVEFKSRLPGVWQVAHTHQVDSSPPYDDARNIDPHLMSIKATLLCINDDRTRLERRRLYLESNQYRVLTANTEQDARLLVTERRVDAIVLECTNDFSVAEKLKRVSSRVPIIAVVNTLDPQHLDADAIDALVASFDGPQFLLETLHFLLKVRPSQNCIGDTQSIRNHFAKSTASAWRARIEK